MEVVVHYAKSMKEGRHPEFQTLNQRPSVLPILIYHLVDETNGSNLVEKSKGVVDVFTPRTVLVDWSRALDQRARQEAGIQMKRLARPEVESAPQFGWTICRRGSPHVQRILTSEHLTGSNDEVGPSVVLCGIVASSEPVFGHSVIGIHDGYVRSTCQPKRAVDSRRFSTIGMRVNANAGVI